MTSAICLKSLRDCKLVNDSTCKCKNHKDAFVLRRALTCARVQGDSQQYDKPMSLMCEAEWAHVKGPQLSPRPIHIYSCSTCPIGGKAAQLRKQQLHWDWHDKPG